MKCINRLYKISIIVCASLLITGCGTGKFDMPYDPDTVISALDFELGNNSQNFDAFASDLCVADEDILTNGDMAPTASAEGLFDLNNKSTILIKNGNLKLAPASLTKVMTAMLAIKYGHLDDTLTASSNVIINESGAQTLGLKEGDRISLRDALHGLLLYSANDCGILIAEYLSGSVEEFSSLMNKTAREIGATNTNFTNPHGLTDSEHYTTVYDLYLIFNEAMKYDDFLKIINTAEYSISYKDRDGNPKTKDISSTNSYLTGKFQAPSNINVIGGKTGTTSAAGSCLILLSYDINSNPYISVILNDSDHDILYNDMTNILSQIP